jgi:predicted dehydrogenase
MAKQRTTTQTSRRHFLTSSSAALAALPLARASYAAVSGTIRIGLIGCGGRGTGAAGQALRADSNVKLVAMADAFSDKIDGSIKSLSVQTELKDKIDVPKDRQFTGFDAYKKVIDNVDVVLLTTPPHFRPLMLKYAIDRGKHVFAEKPIAVDGPGVRSVLESCERAKAKNLSVVSGLCLRYYHCFQDTIKRIHDGDIGNVMSLQANDYRGQIWNRTREQLKILLKRKPTEMEYQMRNWYHFTWLSGDFNVEQHVHNLDLCAWALGAYPTQCVCMGGRMTRPDTGNIYDHFSAVYDYENGAKVYSNTRQVRGRKVYRAIGCEVMGTEGSGEISESKQRNHLMIDSKRWQYKGAHNPFYQTEHDELFRSIRNSKPINNGEYMCKSTLMAIMARQSAYTGEAVTWDKALNSKQALLPTGYTWDATPPTSKIAVPGSSS